MKITEQTQKTQEQRFSDFIEAFKNNLISFYFQIDSQHKEIYNKFWDSEYDPQDISNALGFEKTVLLFQLSTLVQQILKSGDSDYSILVPEKDVEFSNGEIIIKDK